MREDELVGLLEGGVGGISPDGVNEEEEISVLENYGCTVCVLFTVVRIVLWSTACSVIKVGHGKMFTSLNGLHLKETATFLACSLRSGLPSDTIPHIYAN